MRMFKLQSSPIPTPIATVKPQVVLTLLTQDTFEFFNRQIGNFQFSWKQHTLQWNLSSHQLTAFEAIHLMGRKLNCFKNWIPFCLVRSKWMLFLIRHSGVLSFSLLSTMKIRSTKQQATSRHLGHSSGWVNRRNPGSVPSHLPQPTQVTTRSSWNDPTHGSFLTEAVGLLAPSLVLFGLNPFVVWMAGAEWALHPGKVRQILKTRGWWWFEVVQPCSAPVQ